MLSVNAKNAFDTINRKTVFRSINVKCPSLSMYIENRYRKATNLFCRKPTTLHINNKSVEVKMLPLM